MRRMWTDLPCDVVDEILTWSGPVRMATNVQVVAARRIQRRWRRMRLVNGMAVIYKFPWMIRWEVGSVFCTDDVEIHRRRVPVYCIQGDGRLIFDARRMRVRVIPLS